MKPPIILNESTVIDKNGDIDVFQTASALESYLEPWYVDESHFIFDADGLQLEITPAPDRYQVRLAPKEPRTFHPEIARRYFADYLKRVVPPQDWDSIGLAKNSVDTATLPELARACAKFGVK